jgi:hypothetical protein
MTDADRQTIQLFEYALTQLKVDDEGVAASGAADVVTCANLHRRLGRDDDHDVGIVSESIPTRCGKGDPKFRQKLARTSDNGTTTAGFVHAN